MAVIERYFVCASASSALTSVTSGVPRVTAAPSSTCTLFTMPPAIGVTLTSRYAFAITVPGTATDAADVLPVTVAVLRPARVTASGERITSTSPSSVDATGGDGAAPEGGTGGRPAAGGPEGTV